MITGTTRLIVHLGYPTESFKAPMIYNPWFEMKGIKAVVVPVGANGVSRAVKGAVPYDERAWCPGHHATQGCDGTTG
jgi:shikimate 5-dehydrogenase